jgi:hypothetical protein
LWSNRNFTMTRRALMFWIGLATAVFLSRFAHLNILWADEDYHLAVAQQLLHGKLLYRDVWYDKPPLSALLLTLIGGLPGWPLRLFSTLLELAGAAAAFRFAREFWGPREAYIAAAAFVFFHIFFFPATAIPLEPDSLMVLPHLLAVYFAWRKRPALAGILAGLCFLLSTKGAFVALACVILLPTGWLPISAGFALPCLLTAAWLYVQGALPDYWAQVWQWGFLYAGNPRPEAVTGPLLRLAGWAGFHTALWLGAYFGLRRLTNRTLRWKLAAWLGVSLAAVLIGWSMPPRYMSQMFPALILLGSGGLATIFEKRSLCSIVAIIALIIPAARFGPRYAQLLTEDARGVAHDWDNVVMDNESRTAAAALTQLTRPGDTLYVWGYRPNVVVYSGLPVASQLWDSQPVTMVPADRHLGNDQPLNLDWARQHQDQLAQSRPTFIIDGLSAYNPRLDIHNFPRLESWLAQYCPAGKPSPGITIYQLCGR